MLAILGMKESKRILYYKSRQLSIFYELSRAGNPVHRSHYNPADKALIIKVKVLGLKGLESPKDEDTFNS